MLIGIDPLLGPDLLASLRAMGHGDEIAVVDANFPAAAVARRLHRTDGADAIEAVVAIIGVLPLDDFETCAAWSMADAAFKQTPAIVSEFEALLKSSGYEGQVVPLERHVFYERAQNAFAVVVTAERRLYGNLILRKGVVRPAVTS